MRWLIVLILLVIALCVALIVQAIFDSKIAAGAALVLTFAFVVLRMFFFGGFGGDVPDFLDLDD
jgi:hypothetical protein